jgi:GNAT superfamily N-acetyltransferase
MQIKINVTDSADEEIRMAIVGPLAAYNESKAGLSESRPLVVILRDETDAVIGGMWGATGYGWLFTQLLVVPEYLRGSGIGKELMMQAEREAISRGCHSARLDTFEFQARGFYEKLGYVSFGELQNYPIGFSRFFLQKSLLPSGQ